MQNPEGSLESAITSISEPVGPSFPASQQRLLLQTTDGSSQNRSQAHKILASREQEFPQQFQHAYQSQVQYVEGGEVGYANGAMCATYSYNSSSQLYEHDSGSTYFSPEDGGFPVSSAGQLPANDMAGISMVKASSQMISTGGGAYLIQGRMEEDCQHSSDATASMLQDGNGEKPKRIVTHKKPLVSSHFQWLLDNYEAAEGVSLLRSTLYSHYQRHCEDQNLEPVNSASFGKLIRSVFMGLRTRRLGTRGNSKYHYCGIRLKPSSPLNHLQEDPKAMAMRRQPVFQNKRFKPVHKMKTGDGQSNGGPFSPEKSPADQRRHHLQYIDMSYDLQPFPPLSLGSRPLPELISLADVGMLQKTYRMLCEKTLDVVMNLQFHLIERLWQMFWCPRGEAGMGGGVPREKLMALCTFEPVKQWMQSCDHALFQALLEILIPDVLQPVPSTLTHEIRTFAKSVEGWLTSSMSGVPQECVRSKSEVVGVFAQTLLRYTSLNHLAQAADAVLQNTSQINQMMSDLSQVDFAIIQEQAFWVCQCDEVLVQQLEQEFKLTLQQQSSLNQWATWLDSVLNQVLKPYEGGPGFTRAAHQFLLKWSFYSSMVIRELTLRSAASFGSFHLIRMLYDEYMFYLVQHRVSQASKVMHNGVVGEFTDFTSLMPPISEKDVSFSDDLASDEEVSTMTERSMSEPEGDSRSSLQKI